MNGIIRVAIVGAGGRGRTAYANIIKKFPEKIKVVAVADVIRERVDRVAAEHGIPENMCFNSAEELFEKDKLADIAFICTQDRDHYGHAMKALERGYDILLEKPISPFLSECKEIAMKAKEKNLKVIVCHVLRYAPFYMKIKEIIDSGVIGKIITVNAEECVGYWHQAHSFVRGIWRNSDETSPMILAKCCHDFDILLWLTGKSCLKVSSFGNLNYFNKENAPEGSAERCFDCSPETRKNCPYDCEKIYLDGRHGVREGHVKWPVNVLNPDPTEENITEALKNTNYGKCVFRCDNNVVDNQIVNMLFEDNVTVNFTMSAFNELMTRSIRIRGTHGEITGAMNEKKVTLTLFGKGTEVFDTSLMTSTAGTGGGHGGGDVGLVRTIIDMYDGKDVSKNISSIDKSIESHFAALAAEESRVHGGIVVDMKEWIAKF